MASVALCPRCSHDLLVPDGTDPDAWAQCSACNVLFQVRDAISRDLAELKLVEPVPEPDVADQIDAPLVRAHDDLHLPHPTPTIAISSQKTLGDMGSFGAGGTDSLLDVEVGDDAIPTNLPSRSAPTIDDLAKSSAPTWQDADVEGDEPRNTEIEPLSEADADLASARTIAEIPDLPPVESHHESARAGATIEFSGEPSEDADTDFEIESSSAPPPSIDSLATWDDSEQMERLLNGDEHVPDDDAPTPASFHIQTDADESASFDQPIIDPDLLSRTPALQRRRPRSPVRMLTGIMLSGILGLALGYLILLWMLGPSTDFLGIAHYLPSAILPASFSSRPIEVADEPPANVDRDTKPAGFDAPATPAKSMIDDVAALKAEEPSKFEPTEAAPLAGGDAPRVTDAPTHTADELAMALKTAQEARAGLIEGDLGDGKAVQHAKGYSYSMLCELADKETFVDATSRADFVAAMQQAADDLFRTTLANAHTRGEVARIAPLWIASKTRKHGGVFFAGTISGPSPKGSVIECQIDLGSGKPLTLLVPKPQSDGLDQITGPVAVVGSIVDSPAQKVSGYEGDAMQAVWVGRLIPLQ